MEGIMTMENYEKRLSIIVAVYNVEKYLERCVNSLLLQDLSVNDYEILLINDGSTDNSSIIAENYKLNHKNISVISKENGGLSSVRNYGNEHARGRYIMHVDGDDFVEQNSVLKVLEIAERNTLDLCFFGTRRYPDGKIYKQNDVFEKEKMFTGEYLLTHGMNVSSTWCCLYSNHFLNEMNAKYFGRISHQDVEFNLRLYPFAKRVMFVDFLVYNYCMSGESITRTKDVNKLQKNILDQIIIAHNIIEFANRKLCSEEVCNLLIKRMNSSLLSHLLAFCDHKSKFGFVFAKEFLAEASANGVYPIRGRAVSRKMTLLIPFFNMKRAYLIFLWLWNNK